MKIGIYTPYLESIGGGEKYAMSIAETLSKKEKVDVFLDQHLFSLNIEMIKDQLEKLQNLDLSKVNFIKAPFGAGSNFWSRFFFLRKYDYLFYLTDGSIFIPSAKNNIIHFQVPFTNTQALGLHGWLKQRFWKEAIYNSKFTKDIVEKTWNFKGKVIYPPVDVGMIKSLPKKKQIVSVGRFHMATKSKKHDVIIKAFKSLVSGNKLSGWSLHLAGGMEEGSEPYLQELKEIASGIPVYFYPNMPQKDLYRLYGQSSIYWHFKGYGEEDPKTYEHFGISTVEAMAGGCVPVVINKGGQPEIVEDKESGLLWNSLGELSENTLKLINNPKLFEKLSKNAILRSKIFSKEKFVEAVNKMLV